MVTVATKNKIIWNQRELEITMISEKISIPNDQLRISQENGVSTTTYNSMKMGDYPD